MKTKLLLVIISLFVRQAIEIQAQTNKDSLVVQINNIKDKVTKIEGNKHCQGQENRKKVTFFFFGKEGKQDHSGHNP